MNTCTRMLGIMALWLLVMVAHAGTVTYVYTDPQGTPLAEADASGNITARFDYAPYGSASTASGMSGAPNGPGYTGHVNDPDTGLVYMQARYYDPGVGRFLSSDPAAPTAANPYNFNRYAYANNNPMTNSDPTGAFPSGMTGDQIECEIYNCQTFVSGGDDGGSSQNSSSNNIPARTPASMKKYFTSTDTASRMKAAFAVMDYFGIDYEGINSYSYSNSIYIYAQMNPNGQLDISSQLFGKSFGFIGAVLYHEVGVHWGRQFTQKDVILDGSYTQAWFMREVQAYDLELSPENRQRFGLTRDEVNSQLQNRSFDYRHLTPANKGLVGRGIYKPIPSGI